MAVLFATVTLVYAETMYQAVSDFGAGVAWSLLAYEGHQIRKEVNRSVAVAK